MNQLQLTHSPVAKTAMLIRRPVAEAFEAFVNPDLTTRFWFTKSSGRLATGQQVEWTWEMYGFSVTVNVQAVELNQRILIEWPGEGGPTSVEWLFTPRTDDTTMVSITNFGFACEGDALVKQALDSTEGFALVLAG